MKYLKLRFILLPFLVASTLLFRAYANFGELESAISMGNLSMVKQLIVADKNLLKEKGSSKDKESALILAVKKGDFRTAEL